jgi:probable F420-dependent oxidoreductase
MSNTNDRPFRFGVQVDKAANGAAWIELARQVESLGYSTLTMPDHFGDQYAPMVALTAAAAVTTTLRVGALVFDNDYKHPIVLAKELATLDVISNGRTEIGLGAGWMITDYEQAGIPYDAAGARIDRFVEGLEIIRRAMAPGAFSFSGTHYTITEHDALPKPVQAPCPPILIGGGGKRVLGIAAKHADIIGINPSMHAGVIGPEAIGDMTAESVDAKVAIIRAAAGDRMADIELNVRAFLVNVTDDGETAMANLAKAIGVDVAMLQQSPYALIGPPPMLVDKLMMIRERWGINYVIVGGNDAAKFAPVVAELAGR